MGLKFHARLGPWLHHKTNCLACFCRPHQPVPQHQPRHGWVTMNRRARTGTYRKEPLSRQIMRVIQQSLLNIRRSWHHHGNLGSSLYRACRSLRSKCRDSRLQRNFCRQIASRLASRSSLRLYWSQTAVDRSHGTTTWAIKLLALRWRAQSEMPTSMLYFPHCRRTTISLRPILARSHATC